MPDPARIILTFPKTYQFNGINFEVSPIGMPWPLRKDGEPKARAGRGFYSKIKPWLDMAPEFQEAYRTGGGTIYA